MRSRSTRQALVSMPRAAYLFFAILAVSLVFGGGGARYGLSNAVVQIFALAVLLYAWPQISAALPRVPRLFLALLGLTLAIPLLQLLPLPPAIWQSLPGRDLAVATFDLLDLEGTWMPFSLDRARTLTALSALVPALALALGVFATRKALAPMAGNGWLVAIVAMALANFMFGALQLLTSNGPLNWYPVLTSTRFYGFFASHNTSGLLFVIALCALFGLSQRHGSRNSNPSRRRRFNLLLLGCALVFLLGIVLTQSRSSLALSVIPIGAFALAYIFGARTSTKRPKWQVLSLVLVPLAALIAFAASNDRLQSTWDRFDDLEDARPAIWTDTLSGIERYWPAGAGVGTFDEVFQVEESLETLHPMKAGRAHNDYLEVALESGIVGLVTIAAWIVYLLSQVFLRIVPARDYVGMATGLAILSILLQSTIDYPLRNQTIICVAAVLLALLVAQAQDAEGNT